MKVGWVLLGPAAAFTFMAPGTTPASTITVEPVNVQIAPGQSAASVTIVNSGADTVTYQTRIFDWSQTAGEDHLAPTAAVIASPPIATLPPGGSQIVRLVTRNPPVAGEQSWRLWIDEIPSPTQSNSVRIALRISIPIFRETSKIAEPRLVWTLDRQGSQTLLSVTNGGDAREKLHELNVLFPDGRKVPVKMTSVAYVLAGARRRWPIEVDPATSGGAVRLVGKSDSGAIDEVIGNAR